MHLTAVARQSLAEAIFEQLRDRILSGQIPPGEPLPAERELCAKLEVNRASLREALGRLQTLRLISVRQGEPTTVLDYKAHGGLELLVTLVAGPGGDIQIDMIRSLIEMRAALAPDIASNAARRRTTPQLAVIRDSMHALEPLDDVVERHAEHLRFWAATVEASGNIAYRLMFNSLRRAVDAVGDIVAPAVAAETGFFEGYQALVVAIARRQPGVAAKVASDLVGRGTKSMLAILERMKTV